MKSKKLRSGTLGVVLAVNITGANIGCHKTNVGPEASDPANVDQPNNNGHSFNLPDRDKIDEYNDITDETKKRLSQLIEGSRPSPSKENLINCSNFGLKYQYGDLSSIKEEMRLGIIVGAVKARCENEKCNDDSRSEYTIMGSGVNNYTVFKQPVQVTALGPIDLTRTTIIDPRYIGSVSVDNIEYRSQYLGEFGMSSSAPYTTMICVGLSGEIKCDEVKTLDRCKG